jgi:hypothetical protein
MGYVNKDRRIVIVTAADKRHVVGYAVGLSNARFAASHWAGTRPERASADGGMPETRRTAGSIRIPNPGWPAPALF